jgi:hypothetical protein
MEQYRKMMMAGAGVTPANPKRYNFAGNFTSSGRSTIDEQMMGLIEAGRLLPVRRAAPTATTRRRSPARIRLQGGSRVFQEVAGWRQGCQDKAVIRRSR